MRRVALTATATCLTNVVVPNIHSTDFTVGLYLLTTGSTRATVQITPDAVFADGFTASGATWINSAITTTGNGTQSGTLTQPCTGITMNVTTYDSPITLVVVESGII